MNNELQAKALIESGASLREIARCFSTSLDAYRYYAETVRNQFAPATAVTLSECVSCKCASGHQARQIAWRAIAHDKDTGTTALILLLLGRITSRRIEVRFTTAHRYCSACARRLWWSFSLLRFAKSALFALLLIVLFVTVPLVLFTGAVAFSARDLLPRFSLFLAAGVGIVFLLYFCFRFLWTSAVPSHLRFIGRYPFEPLSIRKLDENVA
ncbi:hypothetical protein ACXR0O_13725 [Verrucomicrobiota bacterium sgz303538]